MWLTGDLLVSSLCFLLICLLRVVRSSDVAEPWQFVDYDCLRVQSAFGIDWNGFRNALVESTSTSPEVSLGQLDKFLERFFPLRDIWTTVSEECPLGMLSFLSVYMAVCFGSLRDAMGDFDALGDLEKAQFVETEKQCYATFLEHGDVFELVLRYPLRVLGCTKWPFAKVLSSFSVRRARLGKHFAEDPTLNCRGLEDSVIDWEEFQNVLHDSSSSVALLLRSSMSFVFTGRLGVPTLSQQAEAECPLGFILIHLVRSFYLSSNNSPQYLLIELRLQSELTAIARDPALLLFTEWPVMSFLSSFSAISRHGFSFDYHVHELRGWRRLPDSSVLAHNYFAALAADASPLHRSVAEFLMRSRDVYLPPTQKQLRAFRDRAVGRHIDVQLDAGVAGSAASSSGNASTQNGFELPSTGFVYATMVYGSSFSRYIGAFVRRFELVSGRRNLVLFTLDGTSSDECERVWQGGCIMGGSPSIMHKFLIPWIFNIYDIDVVWIDFDVYFWQDPTLDILEHQRTGNFEILVSGSFASHCICNGIVYFRATEHMRLWLLDVIHWMYDHPYEHDQQCFAAWLNHTERVSFSPLPRSGPVPAWDTLDPVVRFVTAAVVDGNGWMADSWRQVVLFHFLHGESDHNLLDLSGSWLKNSRAYQDQLSVGVGEGRSATSPHQTLMDVFFASGSTLERRIWALGQSRQHYRVPLLDGMFCGFSSTSRDDDADDAARIFSTLGAEAEQLIR